MSPKTKETLKLHFAVVQSFAFLIGLGFLLGIGVANNSRAQPAPPPQQQQSPSERALGNKLMIEINAGLQCSAQLVGAADQIATLQKELADEKAKNAKPAEAPK